MVIRDVAPSVLWYTNSRGVKEYIAFDATMEESHKGAATVSKYPVQAGFQVSNHLIRANRIITVKAYIAEHSLGGIDGSGAQAGFELANFFGLEYAGAAALAGGIVGDPYQVAANYINGAASAFAEKASGILDKGAAVAGTFGWSEEDDLLSKASDGLEDFIPSSSKRVSLFRTLQLIQEKGTMCALSTVLHNYSDLVLIDFHVPTTPDTMTSMLVELTFEQVLVVNKKGTRVSYITVGTVMEEEEKEATETVKKFTKAVNTTNETLGSMFK